MDRPELTARPARRCARAARRRRPRAWRRRRRRRLAVAAVALAILDPRQPPSRPTQLISNDDVAASMPAGALVLQGTHPACTTVKDGVEYHCVLASAPAPEVSDYKGTV